MPGRWSFKKARAFSLKLGLARPGLGLARAILVLHEMGLGSGHGL